MLMTVFDSFGYCRIGSVVAARRPISRISRLTTTDRTGRLMKISVKRIAAISISLTCQAHDPAVPDHAETATMSVARGLRGDRGEEGAACAGLDGAGSVDIATASPDCSLSWPTATTLSPGFTPLTISTRPSTRLPVCTKVRTALRLVLPSASFFSVITNTESPYSV